MKAWFIGLRLTLGAGLLLLALAANAGLKVASWNMKHLGWNNQKNIPAVAQVLSRFDLIGLQEVMHPEELQPLLDALHEETGVDWQASSSRVIGNNSYKEGYAFVWRLDRVASQGGEVLYLDLDQAFMRQPYSALFAAKDGSVAPFIAATIHVKYGSSVKDRTPEVKALADYWQWLGDSFDGHPRILMGDFNLAIKGQKAWRPLSRFAKPYVIEERTTLSKKPGQYANAYDHFWVTPQLNVTTAGAMQVPALFNISHQAAYTYLSDHIPIYLTLGDAEVNLGEFKNPAIRDLSGKPSSVRSANRCIDINQANGTKLATLIHIGPARAKQIIAGRPWQQLADLTRIRGLTPQRVSDIRQTGLLCNAN